MNKVLPVDLNRPMTIEVVVAKFFCKSTEITIDQGWVSRFIEIDRD